MIFKIVRRSMMKKWGLFLAIFALVLLSTMFVGIRHFTYDRMGSSFATMTSKTNPEDFRLYTNPLLEDEYTDERINEIEKDENISIAKEEQKIYKSEDDNDATYQVMPYVEDQEFNQIILDEGSLPTKSNQIVVQPEVLNATDHEIGDMLTIGKQDYEISGTAYFIEEIYPVSLEDQMLVPDFTKYAPVYMNEDSFNKIKETATFTSNFYYSGVFNEDISQEEQDAIYDDIADNYTVEVPDFDADGVPQVTSTGELKTSDVSLFPLALDYDKNLTMSGVDQEIEHSEQMFNFLSTILTLLTVFLAIVLVNSIFKAQRREMGILKAEGVRTGQLAIAFAGFIGIVLAFAAFIGILLALPAANGMTRLYDTMFQIYHYPITTETFVAVGITALIEILIIVVLVYLFSIRKNLKQPTLNLIKNIDKEKVPKLHVDKYLKRVGFKTRYQINIILRNFSKTIFLFFGILFSSFLLMMGIMMYTSITSMSDSTYTTTYTYDYLVNYTINDAITQDKNSFIQTNAEIVNYQNDEGTSKPNDDNDSVTFQTYDVDSGDFVHLTNNKGETLRVDDGLVATDGFLKEYNMAIGDEITVVNPYNTDEEVTMEIKDSTDDFFLPYLYADTDYLQDQFNTTDDFVNGEYYSGDLTDSKKTEIKSIDPDAFIYEVQDMEDMMGDSLQIFIIMIVIIAAFASLIAFISLYSISSIIIDSNRKTISVMKVLGYSNNEIKKMTIGIYKWLVVIIYIALIPVLNFAIQTAVNQALSEADFSLDVQMDWIMSLLGLVLIMIIYLFSSHLTYRKIEKIKLAESLKADE